jgi:two-component system response regulator FixJ
MAEDGYICLIDDEPTVANAAAALLRQAGYAVRCYSGALAFLADWQEDRTLCVVTDLKMPVLSGLELQQRLREMASVVPLVVLSGHADVRTAVRMMEDGAISVLEKPYDPVEFVQVVQRAVTRGVQTRSEKQNTLSIISRFQQLTVAERQALDLMLTGLPNKAIALRLDVSMRTVDRRRRTVMSKMGVDSISELAMLVACLPQDERAAH